MMLMDKNIIMSYIENIDKNLNSKVQLCLIGSVPCILAGAPTRTTGDIDVWMPQSYIENKNDFWQSCLKSDILVVVSGVDQFFEESNKPYLQLIDDLSGIVEVGKIESSQCLTLYKGKNLVVNSVPPANIVASKLVRCETQDISDSVFLIKKFRITKQQIENVIKTFKNDTAKEMAIENLVILEVIGILDKSKKFNDTFLLKKVNMVTKNEIRIS